MNEYNNVIVIIQPIGITKWMFYYPSPPLAAGSALIDEHTKKTPFNTK